MLQAKISQIVRNNIFYLLGFLVLVVAVAVNLFPEGYVLVGGDTPQFIGGYQSLKSLFYDWHGRAGIFYAFFYFLSRLGISDSLQLSFYLGIFIFGSYVSFDIFARLLFKEISDLPRALVSLFYALNLYTLYVFTYAWGYSHYQFLYIFIPLLTGLYVKFLRSRKNVYAVYFALALLLASPGFANPAFALAFFIFLFVLTIFLIAVKTIAFNKDLLKKVFLLGVFSFLVSAYWILPLIPQMRGGVEGLFSENIIDLNWWLRHTSNPLIDTFRLAQYSNWYFPDNFPYPNLLKYKDAFAFLTLIPIFLIVLGASKKDIGRENKRKYLVFLGLLLFFVMLVAKVKYPFEFINKFFYNLWGFNTLRSYEKLAIFTPFIFASLLTIISAELEKTKLKKWFALALAVVLLTPLPFYLGKLQRNMSAVFVRDTVMMEAKDYRKAKYSFLVKIPDEYYSIQERINSDPDEVKIAALPYNVVDSVGWSNYPKWKLAGVDITRQLYNKEFIYANSFYFNQWLFAKDFNELDKRDPVWIAKLLGLMNAKYIIYHKDVEPRFAEQSQSKIEKLELEGYISLIKENDYFNLYQIKDEFIFPPMIWQKEKINLEPSPNSIDENFEKIKSGVSATDFQRINPKKFIVKANRINSGQELVFAEPYDKNWRAYAITDDGKKILLKSHYRALGYANGWNIDKEYPVKEILIEYYPIKLLYWGIAVSSATTLFLAVYLLRYLYAGRKNREI